MSNERIIPTSRNADSITKTIKINGSEIDRTYQVEMISVSSSVNRISTARVVLVDGDLAEEEFQASNADLFIPGNEIEILAGYHSDEASIFKGIIVKHSIKIRSNGNSVLQIECKDEAIKMTVGCRSRYFYESKDSEAMETLIRDHGLQSDVEATNYAHPELVQFDTTDWDFILTRADVNGKICLVENGKLTIKKPDTSSDPVVDLVFGATIREFDGEIDARNQYKAVTAKAWDYANQEVLEIEANDPSVSTSGNLSNNDLADVLGLDDVTLRHSGKVTDTELQDWADAKWQKSQLGRVRGRVKFQGMPEVKTGVMVKLQGVGERFNGPVFVGGVRHTISSGDWETDAQFGIDPEWFSKQYDVHTPPAAAMLPAVQGLQIGLVTQLESDPDGEDRILVRLPVIDPEEQGVWARVASLDAGENRGAFFRPEIGDEVIVGFINADPGDAVVLGMLNSSAKPAPITAADDNHEKGFVTRSEMKFIFDDDKKSVTIETPAGKVLTLDEDANEIKLEDDNGNKIVLDSGGITLESSGDITIKASGDVSIEGTNINGKANAQFKAEGAAGVEVSSSATAVLKGSLVQIN